MRRKPLSRNLHGRCSRGTIRAQISYGSEMSRSSSCQVYQSQIDVSVLSTVGAEENRRNRGRDRFLIVGVQALAAEICPRIQGGTPMAVFPSVRSEIFNTNGCEACLTRTCGGKDVKHFQLYRSYRKNDVTWYQNKEGHHDAVGDPCTAI